MNTATLAKTKLNGFTLNGKELEISYAKTTSDVILKLKNPQEYRERLKKRREEAAKRKSEEKEKMLEDPIAPPKKQPKVPKGSRKNTTVSNEPPNQILFADNLPDDTTVETLNALFQPYLNFVESRLVPGRNVAFIEFNDQASAGIAKDAVHNHKMGSSYISITYAKR